MYATNVFARTQPDGVNIPMFAQSNPQVSALFHQGFLRYVPF